jgi:hypothetical protein
MPDLQAMTVGAGIELDAPKKSENIHGIQDLILSIHEPAD